MITKKTALAYIAQTTLLAELHSNLIANRILRHHTVVNKPETVSVTECDIRLKLLKTAIKMANRGLAVLSGQTVNMKILEHAIFPHALARKPIDAETAMEAAEAYLKRLKQLRKNA